MIITSFFFIPDVKNRVISRLLSACACFAILNIATSFWCSQNCGVIYTNICIIYHNKSLQIFRQQHQYFSKQ